MTETPNDTFDNKECYCRILGHHLHFSYCRSSQDGLPCYKIIDCWFEKFDVRKYIQENFSEAEIGKFLKAPEPKMQTLMTLIQQAQERAKKE